MSACLCTATRTNRRCAYHGDRGTMVVRYRFDYSTVPARLEFSKPGGKLPPRKRKAARP